MQATAKLKVKSKTIPGVFIKGSKHQGRDESTPPSVSCFYCFKVFGTLDEKRSTSF